MSKAKNELTAQLKRSFYNEAKAELVHRYKPVFDNLLAEIYEKNGFTYERELTAEEKAEQKVTELLSKHPNLRSKFKLEAQHLKSEESVHFPDGDPAPNPYPEDPISDAELDPKSASGLSPN